MNQVEVEFSQRFCLLQCIFG